jgi:hypothetical protein
MAKLSAIAIGFALAAAGCSNVLGLKDPTFNDTAHDAAIDTVPTDAMIDTGPGACVPSACQFGCDPTTNACRPAKLWVYLTAGQDGSPASFSGSGFGGADTPPDVRAKADALCFDTFTKNFSNRACTQARTHAIVTVSGADSIQLMASAYSIPTTAEVDRADDGTIVFNNWNDLTDSTKAPRAAVASATTAPTDAEGIVWTGFGVSGASNCTNWTSKLSTAFGGQGHTTNTTSAWLNTGSDRCDFLERLLCVCWSGGN